MGELAIQFGSLEELNGLIETLARLIALATPDLIKKGLRNREGLFMSRVQMAYLPDLELTASWPPGRL